MSVFAGGLPEKPERSIRPSPYPVALGDRILPGLEGLLLHPARIPMVRKRTWRRLRSSKLVRPVYPDPRTAGRACSGAGMQIRGAASLADVPIWRKIK
jgi:hypothetical protein